MNGSVNGYRADLEALDQLLDRLRAFDRRATEVAGDLDGQARRLDTQWSGTASDEHTAAHRRWLSAHDELRHAVGELADLVRTAHANYSAAARANVGMWA